MAGFDTTRDDGVPVGNDAEPGRALVLLGASGPLQPVPSRPLAAFLVQLIDGQTGALRPSRHQRTRDAAARYAAAAAPLR